MSSRLRAMSSPLMVSKWEISTISTSGSVSELRKLFRSQSNRSCSPRPIPISFFAVSQRDTKGHAGRRVAFVFGQELSPAAGFFSRFVDDNVYEKHIDQ